MVIAMPQVMARPLRIVSTDTTQHVIHRGNNRMDIFACDADYEAFLYALHEVTLRHPVKIHTYVLMTNHIHLTVTPESAVALARAMQTLGRRYVPYYNQRYGRTGHMFEGRFRSFEIDSEDYWFTCARYVELNPVRAGRVATPDTYRWSSYAAHAFGQDDPLVTFHWLYLALGDTPDIRQRAWRELCGTPLTIDQLAEIRASVNTGKALGAGSAALGV
jgi:putative transposase